MPVADSFYQPSGLSEKLLPVSFEDALLMPTYELF